MDPKESYNKHSDLYKSYSRANSDLRANTETYTCFKHLGNLSGLRVLDLGCGDGSNVFKASECGAEELVGVDISESMVQKAIAGAKQLSLDTKCRFYTGDCLSFESVKSLLGDCKFDAVMSFYLVPYATSIEELLEYFRICEHFLKEEGLAFSVCSNPALVRNLPLIQSYLKHMEILPLEPQNNLEKVVIKFYGEDSESFEVHNTIFSMEDFQSATNQTNLELLKASSLEANPSAPLDPDEAAVQTELWGKGFFLLHKKPFFVNNVT